MVGRTNAGGGGSASQWYAYIQVSTDANAIITAVNPAGNSYTRTADSTGALTIVVSYPGTYTISETGATSQTVVVADYGVVYSVTIHISTFNGILINDGVEVVQFKAMGVTGYNYTAKAPSIIHTSVSVSGNLYNIVYPGLSNGAGAYVSEEAYDLTGYSSLVMTGRYGQGVNSIILIQENGTTDSYADTLSATSWNNYSLSLSTVDKTKKYHCGIEIMSSGTAYIEVNALKLV